jgi:hypothetical protein
MVGSEPSRSAGGWNILCTGTRIINPSQDACHPLALRKRDDARSPHIIATCSACVKPALHARRSRYVKERHDEYRNDCSTRNH